MAGMNGRSNKKREPWQYVFLLVLFLAVVILPQAYVLRAELETVRIAIVPIKVWQHLIPEHSCVIYPLQLYVTGVPMLDPDKHPDSTWWNVKSVSCHGVAQVGPGRSQ